MPHTKPFEGLTFKDTPIAGGKGASLGEMTQAGIPVPPGFVVLASAFEHFLEETDLGVEIDAILDDVDHRQIHTVENASEKIQSLISGADMPGDIQQEILSSFDTLGADLVAVRSSATSEDSHDAAWAGQLDSHMNIERENVVHIVQECWASLFTPRAIFYRFEKSLHDTKISVAVVIQKMVKSEISGIAFSVHPVTEDVSQMIIEAGWGFGDAVVSGSITPDSYVVEKNPRNILDVNVSTQERQLVRRGKDEAPDEEWGENVWKDVPAEKRNKQKLSKEQIIQLSDLILKIEGHYGFPCDIEWAYEDGSFYITQSRPITTLSTKVLGETEKLDIVSRFQKSLQDGQIEKWEGNFSLLLLGTGIGGCLDPFSKKYNFNFGYWVFCVDGKHGICFCDRNRYVETTLSAYKKFMERGNEIEEIKDFEKLWKQAEALYVSNTPEALKGLTDVKLEHVIAESFAIGRGLIGSTVFSESLDETQIRSYYQQINNGGDFGTFFEHATKPAFNSFALRADKSILQSPQSTELQYIFCDYYLAPEVDELESKIAVLISERGGLEKIREEVGKIEGEIAQNKAAVDKFRSSLNSEQASLFDFAQACMYIRDVRKDPLQKALSVISNSVREFFDRKKMPVEDAALALYSDFLNGLHQELGYAEEIRKRKEQGATVFFSDDETIFEYGEPNQKAQELFEAMVKDTPTELSGNTAYQGNVKGVVKIILNENDFSKFQEGEILVTSMTRPEFVPLMKRAIAVVTDEGGITCHAAIISRELKMPCIIGTKTATRVLKDGDTVEVDADNGVVRVLENTTSLPGPREGDYQRLFKLRGIMYFLRSDIFGNYYKNLNCLLTGFEGNWTSYLPKQVITQTLEDGRRLLSSKEAFSQYVAEFEEYKLRSTQFFENLFQHETLGEEETHQAFEMISEMFKFYSKTEFFYTDEAYKDIEKGASSELSENIKLFEKIKNSGREHLNRLIFSGGYLDHIIALLAKQFSISQEELGMYTMDEASNLFKNKKPSKETLKKRMAAFVQYAMNGQMDYFEGQEAEKILKGFFGDSTKKENELRGTAAHKGKVQGSVKVIGTDYYANIKLLSKFLDEMKGGEILVAETTSPELMPACKKAAAIITDQGGLLSHAAIVSRELNIPCIVGTGNATEILKTGDFVEVDADNGVVRVLK